MRSAPRSVLLPQRGAAWAILPLSLLLILSAHAPAASDGIWQVLGPMPRQGHHGVYDPVADRLIVVGGRGEDDVLHDDVWSVSMVGGGSWSEILPAGETPGPRMGHAVMYDPVRRRLILSGGRMVFPGPAGFSDFPSDLWALPLEGSPAWTRLPRPPGPGPRGRTDHNAVYDPVRDRMVFLGGVDSGTTVGSAEVWALRLSGPMIWESLPRAPFGFEMHTASYDPLLDRIVVLGSRYAQGHDVWALMLGSTPAWIQQPSGSSPLMPPRDLPAAAFDPVGQRMIVHGGLDGYASGPVETWSYSMGAASGWSLLTSAGVSPGSRFFHTAVYDSRRGRVVMVGGNDVDMDVWALPSDPSSSWELVARGPLEPPIHSGHVAAYDPAGQQMVIFGGEGASDAVLWTLSLAREPRWSFTAATGSTPVRGGGIVGVFDTRRHRLLVHGGDTPEVWTIAPGPAPQWTRIDPVSPLPHEWRWHLGIYDPVRDRLIVFGGYQTACVGHHCNISYYYREVWALNLAGTPTWTRIEAQGEAPPALYYASVIYDPLRDRMVVFGGNPAVTPGYAGRTWALTLSDTPSWSVVAEPPSDALRREQHTAVYDALRDRMVVHGGYTEAGLDNDTWALGFEGTPTWIQLHPVGWPLGRRERPAAVYDPVFDRMILHSGSQTRSTLALVWGDTPTAVLISAEPPRVTGSSILLRWYVPEGTGRAVVSRCLRPGEWTTIGDARLEGAGIVRFEDRDVRPGSRIGYRLAMGGVVGGEVWVDVPSAWTLELRPAATPTSGLIAIVFTLGTSEPATIELFDLAGRRLAVRQVSGMVPGPHELAFEDVTGPAGVYLARLTQGDAARVARIVRMR